MNNSFSEYVAIERNQLQEMLAQLGQIKNPDIKEEVETGDKLPINKKEEELEVEPPTKLLIGEDFEDIIQELPTKEQDSARQIMKHLLHGQEFGSDIKTGEIVRFLPSRGFRYRLKGSNLCDILDALCKPESPATHVIGKSGFYVPYGLCAMLKMLSDTPIGSVHIKNGYFRKMLQEYRK